MPHIYALAASPAVGVTSRQPGQAFRSSGIILATTATLQPGRGQPSLSAQRSQIPMTTAVPGSSTSSGNRSAMMVGLCRRKNTAPSQHRHRSPSRRDRIPSIEAMYGPSTPRIEMTNSLPRLIACTSSSVTAASRSRQENAASEASPTRWSSLSSDSASGARPAIQLVPNGGESLSCGHRASDRPLHRSVAPHRDFPIQPGRFFASSRNRTSRDLLTGTARRTKSSGPRFSGFLLRGRRKQLVRADRQGVRYLGRGDDKTLGDRAVKYEDRPLASTAWSSWAASTNRIAAISGFGSVIPEF